MWFENIEHAKRVLLYYDLPNLVLRYLGYHPFPTTIVLQVAEVQRGEKYTLT